MTDLVQRLRAVTEADAYAHPWTFGETCKEAADAIERLSSEVKRQAMEYLALLQTAEESAAEALEASKEIERLRAALATVPASNPGIEWAVDSWIREVRSLLLDNPHRRGLDDKWRQVIRHFGGDPEALIGPCHDELVARSHGGDPLHG